MKRIAMRGRAATLSFAVLSVISVWVVWISRSPADHDAIDSHGAQIRRLQSSSFGTASDAPMKYVYLIIHYHKTGHDIVKSLSELIGNADDIPVPVHSHFNTRREHDPATGCPLLTKSPVLTPGVIHLETAPDMFCDANHLISELLGGGDPDERLGVKIVHLIRDPFQLATSNYLYHSQDPMPEDEGWTRSFDACTAESETEYPDLELPTLWGAGAMNGMDFAAVLKLCNSLYRTHPGLEDRDFYEHLLKLNHVEGLLLATTVMMRGRWGDITRMANNIIKLNELQQFETREKILNHDIQSERRIQVLNVDMEDFKHKPGAMAVRTLKFLLGDDLKWGSLRSIGVQYERLYRGLVNQDSVHVTSEGRDRIVLEAHLRNDEVLGGMLARIEGIVGSALDESRVTVPAPKFYQKED